MKGCRKLHEGHQERLASSVGCELTRMLAQSMTPVFVAAESVLLALRLLLRRLPSVSRLMSTGAPAQDGGPMHQSRSDGSKHALYMLAGLRCSETCCMF